MAADPYTPYAILFEGNWIASGGTSISAPNWAALWIASTQAAGKRIGSGNSRIYRMGNSADYGNLFYDVTKGDNGDGVVLVILPAPAGITRPAGARPTA